MLHKSRIWGKPSRIESAADLAEKLVEHTWTPCSAFEHAGLLFLNDSTSADGAQEYAIVKGRRQIESITFGWCDQAKALSYIERLAKGELGDPYTTVRVRFHRRHDSCRHCA